MRTAKTLWQNRKEKKEWTRRLQSEDPGLEVVHPHAAGIDVGNSAHYVAVRPDRDPEPVRRFECFTADLYRLSDWLKSCVVNTVALQSTGVYWIPLYDYPVLRIVKQIQSSAKSRLIDIPSLKPWITNRSSSWGLKALRIF
jgi:hypothetical protein